MVYTRIIEGNGEIMKKAISLVLIFMFFIMLLTGCAPKAPDGPAINYISLSEYAIVYSDTDTDYAYRAVEYLQSAIEKITGVNLPIQEDSVVTASYEIVVGDTEREISAQLNTETARDTFALMSNKTQVALEGEAFLIAAAAYYFVQTYITEGAFNAVIPTEATLCKPITETPNNYVLLIGDGMGVNHTKLFEAPPMLLSRSSGNSDGETAFYGYLFPNQGFAQTNSLTGITDSAAAATALATGYKTNNKHIGQDGTDQPVKSLTELANELGMATAVMSTEVRTGATPAGFSAHVPDRSDKDAILESQKDIENAGTIINCDFSVFDAKLIQSQVEGAVLDTLTQLEQDEDGFFMMYEEAHIDKFSEESDLNQTFMALARFDQVIGRIMEYACYHPDTFVLITADHETGGLTAGVTTKWIYTSDGAHTGADVPVFVWGQSSEVFDGQTIENTQIPKTFAKMWGVDDFGDPATAPAL